MHILPVASNENRTNVGKSFNFTEVDVIIFHATDIDVRHPTRDRRVRGMAAGHAETPEPQTRSISICDIVYGL